MASIYQLFRQRLIARDRPGAGKAVTHGNHVGEGAGHGKAASIHCIIVNNNERISYSPTNFNPTSLRVAGADKVRVTWVTLNRLLKNSHTHGQITRT